MTTSSLKDLELYPVVFLSSALRKDPPWKKGALKMMRGSAIRKGAEDIAAVDDSYLVSENLAAAGFEKVQVDGAIPSKFLVIKVKASSKILPAQPKEDTSLKAPQPDIVDEIVK